MTIKSTIQHGWEAAEEARDPLGIARQNLALGLTGDSLIYMVRILGSTLGSVQDGEITPAHARNLLNRCFDIYCEGMSSRNGDLTKRYVTSAIEGFSSAYGRLACWLYDNGEMAPLLQEGREYSIELYPRKKVVSGVYLGQAEVHGTQNVFRTKKGEIALVNNHWMQVDNGKVSYKPISSFSVVLLNKEEARTKVGKNLAKLLGEAR